MIDLTGINLPPDIAPSQLFELTPDVLGMGLRVLHMKTGSVYVIDEPRALLEATLEPFVVYGSEETGDAWLRPVAEFCGIDPKTGRPRFLGIEE